MNDLNLEQQFLVNNFMKQASKASQDQIAMLTRETHKQIILQSHLQEMYAEGRTGSPRIMNDTEELRLRMVELSSKELPRLNALEKLRAALVLQLHSKNKLLRTMELTLGVKK